VDNDKQKFWDDLKAPPPYERSCWNCAHGMRETDLNGFLVMGGCAVTALRFCKRSVYNNYSFGDKWVLLKKEVDRNA